MLSRKISSLASISVLVLGQSVQASMYGPATWYFDGLGACGRWDNNNDHVVAVSTLEYAGGSRCGRMVRIHYQGKYVDARVADLCPTCGRNGLDLSLSTFQQLAQLEVGLIQVNWEYI